MTQLHELIRVILADPGHEIRIPSSLAHSLEEVHNLYLLVPRAEVHEDERDMRMLLYK